MADSPRDRRREYCPLGTVTVFRTKTAAARANAPWRDRGPLEFACELADVHVRVADVMNVRLVRGQGVLVTANEREACLDDLDSGKRTLIPLGNLGVIDSRSLGERNMKDKEPKIWVSRDHDWC